MVVPIYCDRGFLKRLLEALLHQSYGDFETLVVNKPCPDPGKDPLRTIKGFDCSLKITVVEQREGLIEEGINLALDSLEDYDVALFVDEDSLPLANWVEEHVKTHVKYPNVGIVGGENTYRIEARRRASRLLRGLIYRPIHPRLRGYLSYFALNGMYIFNPRPQDIAVAKTIDIGGFNMSIKPQAIGSFRLPGATLRGLYWEKYLAMAAILNGYESIQYANALVTHAEETQDSLTRLNRQATALEVFLAPYVLENYLHLRVNRTLLKLTLMQLRLRYRDRVHELGSELALWALENRPSPGEVRARLTRLVSMLKN